jgi:hypothetical protein
MMHGVQATADGPPMQNVSAGPVDEVRAALHVLHRKLKQAAAFGQPGGGRGKMQEETSVMRANRAAVEQQ